MGSNDFGIKIAQPGYDVSSAADFNLYFSSSWPQLKIEKTGQFTITGDAAKDIVTHGLGYPPLTFVFTNQVGFYSSALRGFQPQIATLDSQKISFGGPFLGGAGTVLRYIIFRVPINKPFLATNTNIGSASQSNISHDIGLKVAKPGKSADSTDYRDFTVHSGTRSPMLHTVVYDQLKSLPDGDYKGTHGLEWKIDVPYLPIFFAYYSSDGKTFTMLDTITSVVPKINFDGLGAGHIRGVVLNDLGGTGGYGSIVVLKDPIDTPNLTEVTI